MGETTAVKTRQYEGMFILDANLAGKHWDKAKAQILELMENHSVELIRMEKWEERKLVYEINKHKRGVFVLSFFKASPDALVMLRKTCRMTEWILRELILVHSGEVTDDMFRKPRVREREREESRRAGGRGPRGEKRDVKREEPKAPAKEAPAPPAAPPPEKAPQAPAGEKPAEAPAPPAAPPLEKAPQAPAGEKPAEAPALPAAPPLEKAPQAPAGEKPAEAPGSPDQAEGPTAPSL